MPGNIVKINNYDYLEWYVSDKNIPALVTFLESIGVNLATKPKNVRRRKRKNKLLKIK